MSLVLIRSMITAVVLMSVNVQSKSLNSQTVNSQSINWQPVILEGALKTTVTSINTGYEYQIYIDVPTGNIPAQGYPIVYALDGDSVFATLRQINQLKAWRSKVTGYQQAIIVAIGYTQAQKNHNARARDYTPGADSEAQDTGGADNFTKFISEELKPLITKELSVDKSQQAIFGHSYGGLFVLYTLFKQPQLFTAYIAASPSLWWEQNMVLVNIPENYVLSRDLLVTVGSKEGELEKRPAEIMKILASRKMLPNARFLAQKLASSATQYRFKYSELSGEDHGSAKYAAISRALNFFLLPPSKKDD